MMRVLAAISMCAVLAACGGGGGGGGGGGTASGPQTPPPVQNASPGGIWEGTLASGEEVLGLATESGEFHFITDSWTQYFGTVTTSGTSASGQLTGYTAVGFIFEDGSTRGSGTLTGTLQARSTFAADTTFRTSAGTDVTNSVSLTYNSLYDRDSSLQTLAGNFRDIATGAIVSIDANGQAFAQNPATGCVLNGTASIIDSQYNAYRVEYRYSNCEASNAVLNGITLRGLATLDNTVSPEVLIVGAQGLASGTGLSVVEILERT